MGIWFNNVSKDLHLSSEVPPSDKKTKVAPLVLFYLSLVRRSSTRVLYTCTYGHTRACVYPVHVLEYSSTYTYQTYVLSTRVPRVYNFFYTLRVRIMVHVYVHVYVRTYSSTYTCTYVRVMVHVRTRVRVLVHVYLWPY